MTKPPGLWDVLDSRIVFRNRWITLRADRCRTPDGQILDSYHVVEYGDWIHIVAVTRKMEVLVLREYRHGAGQLVRGLPAGMIEKSDASPLDAAVRELAEETGYGKGRFYSLGSAYANPAVQNNRVHSFLAIDLEQIGEPNFDPSESIETAPMPFEQFIDRVFTRQLDFHCIHLAGVHDALMFILSGGRSPSDACPELDQLRRLALKRVDKPAAV